MVASEGYMLDLRGLNARIADNYAALAHAGYILTYRYDSAGWAAFVARAMAEHSEDGPKSLSPMYDPAVSNVGPHNFFWLEVLRDDRPAGLVCTRLFEVEDFRELVRSGRVWWDRPPRPPARDPGVADHPMLNEVRGRLAFDGSYWIAPGHRGGPITRHLLYLLRDLASRNLEAEWRCAMVRRGPAERMRRFCRNLHYDHHLPFIDAWYPPAARAQPYDLFLSRLEPLAASTSRTPTASRPAGEARSGSRSAAGD